MLEKDFKANCIILTDEQEEKQKLVDRAVLAAEDGTGSDKAVEAAKADLAAVNERLETLQIAWDEAQRAALQEARDKERAKLESARSKCEDLLREMESTSKTMESQSKRLGESQAKLDGLADELREHLKPFGKYLGRDAQLVQDDLGNRPGRYKTHVAAHLAAAGLNLENVTFGHHLRFKAKDQPLSGFVKNLNDSLRYRLQGLEKMPWEDEETA